MSNRIDRLFKNRLASGSLPVTEDMWSRLEPYLPQGTRRDRTGMMWFLGALGIVLIAVVFIWRSMKSDPAYVVIERQQPVAAVTQETPAASTAEGVDRDPRINSADQVMSPASIETHEVSSPPVPTTSELQSWTAHSSDLEKEKDETTVADSGKREETTSSDQPVEAVRDAREVTRIPFLMFGLAQEEYRLLPDPTKDCYDFGKNGGGNGAFFLEMYAGPTYSIKQLASRTEDVSAYIMARDSSEKTRVSWHAGFRAGYLFRPGISLRIGGHYTLVNEVFDYFNGSTTREVIVIDTIRDAGGNIIDIIPDTMIVVGKYIKTTYNHYHTIDIPVLVGYQRSANHWTYGIHAGPVFNVAFWKKGDLLSPADGRPVTFSDSDPGAYPVYQDHLGLSIYAAAHLGRRIGYRTVLYVEPHLHHRLGSLTLNSYPVDQKQTNIGLSAGLRLLLN